ncbi:MAG: DUF4178 domain-containing protein [Oleispira antarctica]|nr:DUF4178 domain-containing protein [Oleispira antarctica]MBQ0792302.1 DUF4178 domain-containing protein [Oleispira antarctica]|tara:strand:- start:3455 stop:4120 length:666 start_codon:yes stop_codon:yes gene_type:complete
MMQNNLAEQFQAVRGLSPIQSERDCKQDIRHVKKGGYLEIKSDTYLVTQVFRYLEVKWNSFKKKKNEYWVTELQLLNVITGEKTFIEWEFDDELEVSQTVTDVQLRELSENGKPISRKTLDDIAEEEYGILKYNGMNYHYVEDDTWAALFYRNESDTPLQVRMYEFKGDDGSYLTLELWEDEDSKPEREAFISKELAAVSIKVLQTELIISSNNEDNNESL